MGVHSPDSVGVDRAATTGPTAETADLPRSARLSVLTAYFVGLSVLWGAVTTIVLPQLVERHVPAAVKTTALSLVASLQAVVAIVVQPVAGAASDRVATPWGRRRPFMVVGVGAQCLFLILLLAAGDYLAIVVAMLLQELASNFAQGPYQGLLPDSVPVEKRGLASGYLGAAQLVGQVAGVAIAGILASNGDLSAAIVFAGAAVLLGMTATVAGITERVEPAVAAARRGWLRDLLQPRHWRAPVKAIVLDVWGRDVLEQRDYVWLLASRLAILMATGTLQPFVYFYLEDSIGLKGDAGPAVAPLAAVVAFVALASAIPGGALTARWGRVRTVLVAAVSGAAGALLFAVAPNYAVLFLVAIPFGVALGVFLAADWALLVEVAPAGESGRYLGLSNTATAGASVLAVAIGGPVADVVNTWGPGYGYRAVFVLAAIEFGVGAWCVTHVHEPGGPGRNRSAKPSASPALLEPILRPIERLDSRLRGVRPIRPEAVLGVELRRHRGPEVSLADGTHVRPGDRIVDLHLMNRRVREIGVAGWQAEGARIARADMAELAAWSASLPPDRRPVAYHGETILASFARFGGFEIRDVPADRMHILRAWYLRGLLARWSPQGRLRLERGRRGLRLRTIWLSDAELRRRFGAPHGASGRGGSRGRYVPDEGKLIRPRRDSSRPSE
jgi:MFS family permease